MINIVPTISSWLVHYFYFVDYLLDHFLQLDLFLLNLLQGEDLFCYFMPNLVHLAERPLSETRDHFEIIRAGLSFMFSQHLRGQKKVTLPNLIYNGLISHIIQYLIILILSSKCLWMAMISSRVVFWKFRSVYPCYDCSLSNNWNQGMPSMSSTWTFMNCWVK